MSNEPELRRSNRSRLTECGWSAAFTPQQTRLEKGRRGSLNLARYGDSPAGPRLARTLARPAPSRSACARPRTRCATPKPPSPTPRTRRATPRRRRWTPFSRCTTSRRHCVAPLSRPPRHAPIFQAQPAAEGPPAAILRPHAVISRRLATIFRPQSALIRSRWEPKGAGKVTEQPQ